MSTNEKAASAAVKVEESKSAQAAPKRARKPRPSEAAAKAAKGQHTVGEGPAAPAAAAAGKAAATPPKAAEQGKGKAAPGKAQDDTAKGHAEAFLIGRLMNAARLHFCTLTKPWGQLPEKEQGRVLVALRDGVRKAVREALDALVSHERLTFRAEVDSVAFKGGSVKAVMKLTAPAEAHALADCAGHAVTLVVEDREQLLALEDEAVAGQPEQKPLI